MTIDECVRALAEKMEPKPTPGTIISYAVFPGPDEESVPNIYGFPISKYQKSIGGWWRKQVTVDSTVDLYDWQPISPLDSAECSERLLEAMPHGRIENVGRVWVATFDLTRNTSIHGDAEHKNRRMAIFLAALKWQGIEEPEVGG